MPPAIRVEDRAVEGPTNNMEEVLSSSPETVQVVAAFYMRISGIAAIIIGTMIRIIPRIIFGGVVARHSYEAKGLLEAAIDRAKAGEKAAQIDEGFSRYFIPAFFPWPGCELWVDDGTANQRQLACGRAITSVICIMAS